MNAHPAAEVFPMLPEPELRELADDIKARGLLEPITVYEGKILDGRNRYRACEIAGVEPRFVEWDGTGGSPVLWVISKNLKRRHLNESQRAAVGLLAEEQLAEEGLERKAAGGRMAGRGRPLPGKDSANWHYPIESEATSERAPRTKKQGPRSTDKAANAVGASGRSVARAKRVKAAAPELLEKVRLGERTLASAEHEVRVREQAEKAAAQIAEAPVVSVALSVGDATALPLADGSVTVVFTSPPYGLEKPYRGQSDLAEGWAAFMGDWLREAYRATETPGRLVLNVPLDTSKGGYRPTWPQACAAALAAGWDYRTAILWDKGNSTKGNRGLGSENSADAPHPVAEVEVLGLFSKGDWRLADGRPSDITPHEWQALGNGLWQLAGETKPWEGHPAPFSEELARRVLVYLSRVGDTVLDPFSGSGTTVLVARRLKRVGVGFDISAEYVASARRRVARDDERSVRESVTAK